MIDTQLKSDLYRSIESNRKEHPYEHWHVSSMSECPRAHYFKRLQIPATDLPTAGKILRWDGGHALEEAIRPRVEDVFEDVTSNVRFTSDKLDLTGEYDNYDAKTKSLVEIKSVHDSAFKKTTKDGVTLMGLKDHIGFWPNGNKKWAIKEDSYPHYQLQQHGLAKLMAEQGLEVENIYYVYISLGGMMVVYKETPDPDITAELDRRLEILNTAWATKTPPDCICDRKNHLFYPTTMQYCNYKQGTECCSLTLLKGVNNVK